MKNLKGISIDGEFVYLKKGWAGWRVIEPIKDPQTNKIVWKNVFNKKGFLVLGFLLLLLGLGYLGFKEQIKNYQTVMEEPCIFCKDTEFYQYKENPLIRNLNPYKNLEP